MRHPAYLLPILALSSNVLADPLPQPPRDPGCPPVTIIDRGAPARAQARKFAVAGASLWIASTALAFHIKREYEAGRLEHDKATNLMRYGATSLFLAGTAALAGAAYLHFGKGQRGVAVVPVASRDRAGATLVRHF